MVSVGEIVVVVVVVVGCVGATSTGNTVVGVGWTITVVWAGSVGNVESVRSAVAERGQNRAGVNFIIRRFGPARSAGRMGAEFQRALPARERRLDRRIGAERLFLVAEAAVKRQDRMEELAGLRRGHDELILAVLDDRLQLDGDTRVR